jgi:hypothetical protein
MQAGRTRGGVTAALRIGRVGRPSLHVSHRLSINGSRSRVPRQPLAATQSPLCGTPSRTPVIHRNKYGGSFVQIVQRPTGKSSRACWQRWRDSLWLVRHYLKAACDNPQQCHHHQKNRGNRNKLEVLETERRLEVVVDRTSM